MLSTKASSRAKQSRWLPLVSAPPSSTQIHVHAIDRRIIPIAEADLTATFSAAERQRLNKFRSEKAREQFIHSRGLLRRILSRYLNCAPEYISILQQDQDKPYIEGNPLQFSVSHSGDWLLIAVSQSIAIGVDIEIINDQRKLDEIAKQQFSQAECLRLQQSVQGFSEAFFRIWTGKEALIKASELPFWLGLTEFEVFPDQDEQQCRRQQDEAVDVYQLKHLDITKGYPAAIAWQGEQPMDIQLFTYAEIAENNGSPGQISP